MTTPKYLIFSDLDGSLLDHDTYEFDAALPALREVRSQNIPLVLCSSKTASEILTVRNDLRNEDPFISENGAAIYIPENYFHVDYQYHRERNGYRVIELGTHYPELRQALTRIRSKTGYALVGFGDLTVEEVQKVAGLSRSQAKSALQREYDEPFYLTNGSEATQLADISARAEEIGVTITTGSRFHHLIGGSDKGKAVRHLKKIYQREWRQAVQSVGIGDTLNDLPLLESVDQPILVLKYNNEYEAAIVTALSPTLAEGIGPEGWNVAVLELLADRPPVEIHS